MSNLSDVCSEIKGFDTTNWCDYKRYDVDHNLLAHYKKDDNGEWQDVFKETLQTELSSLIETIKSYDEIDTLFKTIEYLQVNATSLSCESLSQWCKNLKMYIEIHNKVSEENSNETN